MGELMWTVLTSLPFLLFFRNLSLPWLPPASISSLSFFDGTCARESGDGWIHAVASPSCEEHGRNGWLVTNAWFSTANNGILGERMDKDGQGTISLGYQQKPGCDQSWLYQNCTVPRQVCTNYPVKWRIEISRVESSCIFCINRYST